MTLIQFRRQPAFLILPPLQFSLSDCALPPLVTCERSLIMNLQSPTPSSASARAARNAVRRSGGIPYMSERKTQAWPVPGGRRAFKQQYAVKNHTRTCVKFCTASILRSCTCTYNLWSQNGHQDRCEEARCQETGIEESCRQEARCKETRCQKTSR